jgi:sterol desaturase/sphingolipid hydroxylase (fatty acid hydroxylase superfamily)
MLRTLSSVFAIPSVNLAWPIIEARDIATVAVLAAFFLFLALDARNSRKGSRRGEFRCSVRANIALFLFNDTVMSLLSASSLLLLAQQHGDGGLLSPVRSPLLQAVLAFVLLDLSLYLWHRANHRCAWLWRFHRIHHSDLSVNASTAFRLHFVEVLLTLFVKAVFILATGVHAAQVVVNEALIAVFVLFHHSGLSFRAEGWLGRLIIVPSLHRAHHSARREEHDHNYGAVFSVWDRALGTLIAVEPIRVGLLHVGPQSFWDLLVLGFKSSTLSDPLLLRAKIAEAAYFKAEKRGFNPGLELLDWLDAERELGGGSGRI